MNNDLLDEKSKNITVDPEQLKIVVGIIKKCAFDLKNAKEKSDEAWNACKGSLGENITRDIDEKREINQKNFENALEKLERYADNLNSVSNIWKETETEIISSSKEMESSFIGFLNNLPDVFKKDNK